MNLLLRNALPEIATELARGFHRAGRPDLAEQVERLELVDRCPCSDGFCATFYTQPNESWDGRVVERFVLEMPGLTCLHSVDGVVARVELLRRPEVRDQLRALFPVTHEQAELGDTTDGER